jgi:hypothetical protein
MAGLNTDFEWTPGRLSLVFTTAPDRPVVLNGLGCAGEATTTRATQPLVELIVTGDGRARTTTRFTNTGVGSRLRYVGHTTRGTQEEARGWTSSRPTRAPAYGSPQPSPPHLGSPRRGS